MSTSVLAPPADPVTVVARTYDPSGPYLRLRVRTAEEQQVVDLTEALEAFLRLTAVPRGLLVAQTLHTTTAIVVNEQEPLLHGDLFRRLEALVPRSVGYDHDDPTRRVVNRVEPERTNGHAHCRAMLLGATACVPVMGGRLLLGRWQRVLFVELDGPQERTVVATLSGGGR